MSLLDMAKNAQTEADYLLAEKWDPVFESKEIEVVKKYLLQNVKKGKERLENITIMLDNMAKTREQLTEERDRVNGRLRLFFAVLSNIDKDLAESLLHELSESTEEKESINKAEFAEASIRKAAIVVLERAGKPMLTREIMGALIAGGKVLADNASSVVSAALSTRSAKRDIEPIKKPGEKKRWALKKWGLVQNEIEK
jgi:hypothetical protein